MRAVLMIAAFVSASCVTPAHGQDADPRVALNTNGLVIEAVAGWDNHVDRTRPVPVSFLLTNSTDALVEATVHLTNPLDRNQAYLGDVTLAPQTTRRFAVIRDLTDWHECYAELRSRDKVLWRREVITTSGDDFSTNENFVLLIDDSGRRLVAKNKNTRTAATSVAQSYGRLQVTSLLGRSVISLNATTWQIPDHPAPLASIQAIVFPEACPAKNINKAQWRALAEWICEGGTVFVHAESTDVVSSLTKESPLAFELAEADQTRPVRRMGLGQIREYEQNLFSSAGAATRQEIVSQVGQLEGSPIRELVEAMQVDNADYQTKAQLNRIYVAALFGFYTLFIGLFALLMFRFSRRKVAIYTVLVVATASVAAGVLGGILRISPGDLKWGTITYVGAGGYIQYGRINVQSSGGSNEDVAIKGETPDLQFTRQPTGDAGYSSYYYYGEDQWDSPSANPPFDYQVNQFGSSVSDAYKVKIRMSPWGRRQLHATDYKRGASGLDLKLDYTPKEDNNSSFPAGEFKLTAKNPEGLQINACELIIGVSRYRENEVVEVSNGGYEFDRFGNYVQVAYSSDVADNLVELYQSVSITLPTKNKPVERKFQAGFRGDADITTYTEFGRFIQPKLDRAGTIRAWFVGTLVRSPGLQIDASNTEFVPHNELHVFIQEITPENMPALKLLVGGPDDALDPQRVIRAQAAADAAAVQQQQSGMGMPAGGAIPEIPKAPEPPGEVPKPPGEEPNSDKENSTGTDPDAAGKSEESPGADTPEKTGESATEQDANKGTTGDKNDKSGNEDALY